MASTSMSKLILSSDMKSIIKKNKRGISEIVSYALLIIIAISISVGVYAWIKTYIPSENERLKCPEDAVLAITDYNCTVMAGEKILQLKIENKGFFNLDGFFIRAGNDSDKLPTVGLNTTDFPSEQVFPGEYFKEIKTGEVLNARFRYGELTTIKRVQIQPIYNTTICQTISDIRLENC